MTLPQTATLFRLLDATWPPERVERAGDWLRRIAPGGGSRVNAATAEVAAPSLDGCGPLIMVRTGEEALAERLAASGYRVKDPCRLLVARCDALAALVPAGPRTIAAEAPIARMEEIWAGGGIGPARLAIMARSRTAKAYIAGRVGDRPAGCVYVGAEGDVAMLHALEVAPDYRRHGLARDLVAASAHWAAGQGAVWLSLIVTEANAPANALYDAMGFTLAGRYHYRIKEDTL